MAALDAYAQPVDRTQQVQTDEFNDASDDIAARRKERQDAMQQEQSKVDGQQARTTAAGDINQTVLDPHYRGMSYGELPDERVQHFQTAYPNIPDIPGMYNQAAQTANAPLQSTDKYQRYQDPSTGTQMRFDPKTGTSEPIPPSNSGPGAASQFPITGDAALVGLNPEDASVAKQIANYQLPYQSLSRIPGPQRLRILSAVQQFDPTFDANQYPTRAAAMRDFMGGGKAFQNITAANTVMGHLNDLDKASQQLGNVHSGNPIAYPINAIENFGRKLSGSPELTNYNQVRDAVATELAKTFQGGAPHQAEIKSALDNLSAANTPEQTRAAIKSAVELVGSRLGELHDQYQQSLGKEKQGSWLNPRSAAIIRQFGIDPGTIEPGAGTGEVLPPAATAPSPQGQLPTIANQAQFDALTKGSIYINNGQRFQK